MARDNGGLKLAHLTRTVTGAPVMSGSTQSPVSVAIRTLPHFEGLTLPRYETLGAAGMDVRAALPEHAPLTLAPGERAMIPTGFCVALPEGWELQMRPRSGLAAKHGITCLNSPGTIDSDYRGELQAILINHGTAPFTIRRGERIGQLVLAPVFQLVWQETDTLPDSARGTGGFGSTGV
jgi:dUTP pyrophosphatase